MAQQKSILKLKGTIGGITFYKTKKTGLFLWNYFVCLHRVLRLLVLWFRVNVDFGILKCQVNGAKYLTYYPCPQRGEFDIDRYWDYGILVDNYRYL